MWESGSRQVLGCLWLGLRTQKEEVLGQCDFSVGNVEVEVCAGPQLMVSLLCPLGHAAALAWGAPSCSLI